ncbi:hypothetical protein BV25DRAFT_1922022 [Artomyces pyxidatus]|uniref:Uncharacterized protein n=1 Tax=Artomyces pyxidatus TaxID=48021 RepID=A0ACB8SG63_9AGAM|nr:hypothetical protein BV25DRAFT_1922022 [Artomyces pyxidatus]
MDLPDAPEDVCNFLKALYFPRETQRHLPPSSPIRDGKWAMIPESYHGILRLAVKYDAEDIRVVVINALKTEWPLSLSEWDLLRSKSKEAVVTLMAAASVMDTIPLFPDAGKIIRLARDCNVPDLLPSAYYDLMCNMEMHIPLSPFHEPRLEHLSADDLKCLARGRAVLRTDFGYNVKDLIFEVAPPHNPRYGCEKVIRAFRVEHKDLALVTSDILLFYADAVKALDKLEDKLCRCCSDSIRGLLQLARKSVWDSLPRSFRLNATMSVS